MIPDNIKNAIGDVEKLRVENTSETIYWFEPKTSTLYVPVTETNFNSMFSFCKFKSVDLCIDNHVKYDSDMFSCCYNLKEIIFTKKLNLSEANSLYGLFSNCVSLEYFDFKDIILSNKLECLTYIFYDCHSLKEVNFGDNFPSENITSIDFAFYKCMSLNTIYWAGHQAFKNLNCIDSAFFNCERLKQIDLRGADFSNILELNSVFNGTNPDLKVFVNDTFREEMIY